MTKLAKSPCALLLAASSLFLALACAAEPATPEVVEQAQPDATTSTQADAEPEPGVPKIASDEATFDFGAIKPVDSIEHIFKVKNEGSADLHIERVQKT